MYADGIEVGGDVRMAEGFQSSGEVRLLGAKIGGQFVCSGGVFANPGGTALYADGIKVGGDVGMAEGFRSSGEVRLLGAKIDGQWACDGGAFANPRGDALSADGIEVSGAVRMAKGFRSSSEVRLLGAKIGGQFVCDGGIFDNPGGDALSAQGVEVQDGVYLRCSVQGLVSLRRATFHSALYLGGAIAKINLSFARAGVLHDDHRTWSGQIDLEGFVYGSFGPSAPVTAKERIKWLERQSLSDLGETNGATGFKPQPWIQARKVLREMGHYEAAREVGIAFETRKRRIGLIGGTSETVPRWCPKSVWPCWRWSYRFVAEWLHWCYWLLVSYGYRPLKLVFFAAIVWLTCSGLYLAGSNNGVFAPTNPMIYQTPAYVKACGWRGEKHPIWTRCKAMPEAYTTFDAGIYSLNVLLPVGDLGQVSSWGPMTATALGWVVQGAVWFETLFGWLASLLLVAVLSGLVKRDE